jgi:hypothetical protein
MTRSPVTPPALISVPWAKIREDYQAYRAHCEDLGLSLDTAQGIMCGVAHVVRRLPAGDTIKLATAAATEWAARSHDDAEG